MKKIIALTIAFLTLLTILTTPTFADSTELLLQKIKQSRSGSAWSEKYFVDDFGDPMGKPYITTKFIGKFSNSASLKAPLCGELVISIYSGNLAAILYLYTYCSGNREKFNGTLSIKNSKNQIIKVDLYNTAVIHENAVILIDFLKKSIGKVKCFVESEDDSIYNFKLDTTGVTKALHHLEFR